MKQSRSKIRPTRETLVELYENQRQSLGEIGDTFHVELRTVGKWLFHYGIKARPRGAERQIYLPKDEVTRLYRDLKWSTKQLRDHFGCGTSIITSHLREYGLTLTEEEKRSRLMERNQARYPQSMDHKGYRHLRQIDHPYAWGSGYVAEHRLVVESNIGRHVLPSEEVHHINLVPRDNRVENLAVLLKSDHTRVHKYMNRVAAYLCHLTDIQPDPLVFGAPVFWGGKYITSLDLISDGAQRYIAEAVADNNDFIDFEQVRAGGVYDGQRIN